MQIYMDTECFNTTSCSGAQKASEDWHAVETM